MSSDPSSPASWNTPENNPLYPLPIKPMDPDDPLLQEEPALPAGGFRLDIGFKPVRTREELRTLVSVLGLIQEHLETLKLPNVKVSRIAIMNISDAIEIGIIDQEINRNLAQLDALELNPIPEEKIQGL